MVKTLNPSPIAMTTEGVNISQQYYFLTPCSLSYKGINVLQRIKKKMDTKKVFVYEINQLKI